MNHSPPPSGRPRKPRWKRWEVWRSTLLFLAVINVFVLFHLLVFWRALPFDAVLIANRILGVGCYRQMDNTAILGAIYSGLFFVVSGVFGIGELLRYLEPVTRPRQKKALMWHRVRIIAGCTSMVGFGMLTLWCLNGMC